MSYRVKVNRDELYNNLKPVFRAYKPSEIGRVILSYADGRLLIDAGIARCYVTAEGEWQGPVTVSYRGRFLKAIKHLPKVPEVFLIAQGKSLFIAGTIIQCKCVKA